MKKLILTLLIPLLILVAVLTSVTATTHAQQPPDPTTDPQLQAVTPELLAIITSPSSTRVEGKALFDASKSTLLDIASRPPTYRWNFGDGSPLAYSKEVLHDFKEPGFYKVTLVINQQGEESTTEKEIFAYNKKILLITDPEKQAELSLFKDQAAEQGVLINILSPRQEASSDFLAEEDLIQKFTEDSQLLSDTNSILFYTKNARGMQAFNRYFLNLDASSKTELSKKFFVRITDNLFSLDTEIASRSFNIIRPKNILITRKESLNPLLSAGDQPEVVSQLISRGIEFSIIDERSGRSFFFFLSSIISNFAARGVPTNIMHLILAFPFIALFITLCRQVVGVLTFGVFIPAMLSAAFLILGIDLGLIVVIIIVAISYLLRQLLSKVEILYIPKISLILSCISLSLLLAIWFQITFKNSIPVTITIFPMLFMTTISEKFISAQSEEGTKQAFTGVLQTLIVSVIAYYLVANDTMSQLIISVPEVVLVPLILIFLLGKFTGLRITEYLRFKSLLKGSEGVEE